MAVRPNTPVLLQHLPNLPLHRLDITGDANPADAGLLQISLPWPVAPAPAAGDGTLDGGPVAFEAIGQWHGVNDFAAPRRLLLTADAVAGAPPTIRFDPSAIAGPSCAETTEPPTAATVLFEKCSEEGYMWERHYLRLDYGGRSIGLAMGLRRADGVHWWEACRLISISDSPTCRVYHMAGAIPVKVATMEEMSRPENIGYTNPYLHLHNWLNGDLYVRAHANGVVEVFAHHINSQFFDDGRPHEDVVPVVGFVSFDGKGTAPNCAADGLMPGIATIAPEPALARPAPLTVNGHDLRGIWTGDSPAFRLGDVALDLSEPARLATAAQPGALDYDGDFLVWQPYEGVDMVGGIFPRQVYGDDWLFHARDHIFPRGVARTLRFTLSLGDRSPRVARYLAPYWWYAANAEMSGDAFLPVSNIWDDRLDSFAAWARYAANHRGFEDGAVPRGAPWPPPETPPAEPNEPGWDGDVPHGQFLLAWRSGQAADYYGAMRSAYYHSDVCFDHSSGRMLMHGYPSGKYALPHNRAIGTIAAYLETGDPYLLHVAECTINGAWQTHRNSWPRMAIGRDACFIRGAVMLYRYFNNQHFHKIAREASVDVLHSQNPQGTFGDQGGGTGIHQWAAYIVKPWMGCLATAGLLDYLELHPENTALRTCILRFGDWLLANQWQRDGLDTWSYQHSFAGQPRTFYMQTGTWTDLPSRGPWQQDHFARILGMCTLFTGDPRYIDSYLRSMAGDRKAGGGGHSLTASSWCLPWLQSHFLRPRLTADGFALDPLPVPANVPRDASVVTPSGLVPVTLTP